MARMGIEQFKRAMATFKAIATAMAMPQISQQQAALAAIPEYRSRGKGRGTVSCNWLRPYCNNGRSNHPHQSKQECARRRRQINLLILNRENGLVVA